ncbi:MAG: tRNA preQ1(34) S-adenosylmethionine ribosyltransferase-isomerase QueA [Candidatus Liptonbacteria bacterium]
MRFYRDSQSDMSLKPEDYDYKFPPELIAQEPAHPRDSARLMVYERKTGRITLDNFENIDKYIPPQSLLVLNHTKVIPARLTFRKSTGAKVRGLYLGVSGEHFKFLMNKSIKPGEVLKVGEKCTFKVICREGGEYLLKIISPNTNMVRTLEKHGETPIPPYIKHSLLKEKELRREYQAVFAKKPGSVAAPTASLHFTHKLLNRLRKRGCDICYVTLHVNLGTFAPVKIENIKTNKLHLEEYEISVSAANKINRARKYQRPIIAVGTTVVRALESAVYRGKINTRRKSTDLFIRPGYNFRIIDGLITNFHVPRSSLLMLVSALVGREEIMRVYRIAIKEKFRIFSFGDGMFII